MYTGRKKFQAGRWCSFSSCFSLPQSERPSIAQTGHNIGTCGRHILVSTPSQDHPATCLPSTLCAVTLNYP
ncbi:hypothetical protein Pcinc_035841 [Petrolisthes cinctipes]|uniref:Uncharacterized protein n=1 Tax=Petrolisthes cinctipes TaxID=88211 RepID=A0AAE1BVP9_PETCI|nr:hypothetical protein Pcinc_035841 [Petrolisthes cinctipes]